MRERLTLAFVAVTLVLLGGAGLARSAALRDQAHDRDTSLATQEAMSIARLATARQGNHPTMQAADLRGLVEPDAEVSYRQAGRAAVTVRGRGFPAGNVGAKDFVEVQVGCDDGVFTLRSRRARGFTTLGVSDPIAVVAVIALVALIAGLGGYVVARAMSAPFRQLALAAAALGRGRFDLDLPDTKIPEARAIATALAGSAAQLRGRIAREQEFGLHASHVLRTPLTSLRLHLEELIVDPTLSEQARAGALDCLRAVGRLSEVAGELVDLSGRGVLVAGAALPLRDVATVVAQRWADALEQSGGRRLTASVEGDIELSFTPGPIEQILDVVLGHLVLPDEGETRLVFEGAASLLQIDVICLESTADGVRRRRPRGEIGSDLLATVVALGGRIEPTADGSALRIHLPRR